MKKKNRSGDEIRTRTAPSDRRILSPLGLPIPPLRQTTTSSPLRKHTYK